MLKMKLKNTQLTKISNSFYKKHKESISDIILYGSFIRGKETPKDLDILILFKNQIDKDQEYDFKKQLKHITPKVSLISKTVKSVKESSFVARESVIFEGYSLIHQKYISSDYNANQKGIFLYRTNNLPNNMKTRFYYALNGRNSVKGIVDQLNCIKLSDNVLLAPLENIERIKEFLTYWDIEYTFIPTLIPSRLDKKQILSIVS